MDIRKVKKYSSIFSIDEKGIDGKKMNNSWVLCGIGILFCCSGVILFFKKVYEDQVAFKREGYLWMQLAEYTFDTFMMIQQRNGKL